MKTRTKIAAAAAGVVALGAVGAGTWIAVADDEVTDRGVCGGIAYEISVEEEDGGQEVSFELQSRSSGEVWQVLVTQGEDVLLDGERTTDEDAELDLDAPARSGGADDFTVTATPVDAESGVDGDACTASLTR